MGGARAMFRVKGPGILEVEVITINPIMIGHCEHCEILMKGFGIDHKPEQLPEYPKEILEASSKITRLIDILSRRAFVRVTIVEALTLRGILKMIWHGSGRLPLIVVGGRKVASGVEWDPAEVAEKILGSADLGPESSV